MCPIILVLIITGAGLLGGFTNYLLAKTHGKTNTTELLKAILVSLCAAWAVPLFLQLISNNILDGNDTNYPVKNYFILAGFCVLAAYYSKRFLEDIYSKINKAEKKANEAKEVAQEANRFIEDTLNEEEIGSQKRTDNPIFNKSNFIQNLTIDQRTKIGAGKFDFINRSDNSMEKLLEEMQNSKYRDRSIQGLYKATGIPEDQILSILSILEKAGLVGKAIWYGRTFYRLTSEGKVARLGE
jgi:hypothetical protein